MSSRKKRHILAITMVCAAILAIFISIAIVRSPEFPVLEGNTVIEYKDGNKIPDIILVKKDSNEEKSFLYFFNCKKILQEGEVPQWEQEGKQWGSSGVIGFKPSIITVGSKENIIFTEIKNSKTYLYLLNSIHDNYIKNPYEISDICSDPLGIGGEVIIAGENNIYIIKPNQNSNFDKIDIGAGIIAFCAGDINGDTVNEIIACSENEISLFSRTGQLVWKNNIEQTINDVFLQDINTDGKKEIVLIADNCIYCWNYNNTLILNFLITPGYEIKYVVYDNGRFFIVTKDDYLEIYDSTGNLIIPQPISLNEEINATPIMADVNQDGENEIIICADEIMAFNRNGNLLESGMFAFPPAGKTITSISTADIDNDDIKELICGTEDGDVHILYYYENYWNVFTFNPSQFEGFIVLYTDYEYDANNNIKAYSEIHYDSSRTPFKKYRYTITRGQNQRTDCREEYMYDRKSNPVLINKMEYIHRYNPYSVTYIYYNAETGRKTCEETFENYVNNDQIHWQKDTAVRFDGNGNPYTKQAIEQTWEVCTNGRWIIESKKLYNYNIISGQDVLTSRLEYEYIYGQDSYSINCTVRYYDTEEKITQITVYTNKTGTDIWINCASVYYDNNGNIIKQTITSRDLDINEETTEKQIPDGNGNLVTIEKTGRRYTYNPYSETYINYNLQTGKRIHELTYGNSVNDDRIHWKTRMNIWFDSNEIPYGKQVIGITWIVHKSGKWLTKSQTIYNYNITAAGDVLTGRIEYSYMYDDSNGCPTECTITYYDASGNQTQEQVNVYTYESGRIICISNYYDTNGNITKQCITSRAIDSSGRTTEETTEEKKPDSQGSLVTSGKTGRRYTYDPYSETYINYNLQTGKKIYELTYAGYIYGDRSNWTIRTDTWFDSNEKRYSMYMSERTLEPAYNFGVVYQLYKYYDITYIGGNENIVYKGKSETYYTFSDKILKLSVVINKDKNEIITGINSYWYAYIPDTKRCIWRWDITYNAEMKITKITERTYDANTGVQTKEELKSIPEKLVSDGNMTWQDIRFWLPEGKGIINKKEIDIDGEKKYALRVEKTENTENPAYAKQIVVLKGGTNYKCSIKYRNLGNSAVTYKLVYEIPGMRNSGKPITIWEFSDSISTGIEEKDFIFATPVNKGSYVLYLGTDSAAEYYDISIKEYTEPVPPPFAKILTDKNKGNIPMEIIFQSAINTIAGIKTIQWYFGDGTTSSEPNPIHTYTNKGTYNVSLVVTDNIGQKSVDSIKIIVEEEKKDEESETPIPDLFMETLDYYPNSYILNEPPSVNLDSDESISAGDLSQGVTYVPTSKSSEENIENPLRNMGAAGAVIILEKDKNKMYKGTIVDKTVNVALPKNSETYLRIRTYLGNKYRESDDSEKSKKSNYPEQLIVQKLPPIDQFRDENKMGKVKATSEKLPPAVLQNVIKQPKVQSINEGGKFNLNWNIGEWVLKFINWCQNLVKEPQFRALQKLWCNLSGKGKHYNV